MNGAESLIRTLINGGIEVCFSNPGTSEMHFVAAVDRVEGLRCILGLHENIVSGAADGYARMTDRPAATLLHLGPGLANSLANLHNARRARVPMVNIVGDLATYHRECDPPLHSDIESVAKPFSAWIKSVEHPDEVPAAAHSAIEASLQAHGQIATLILPADCCWEESTEPVTKAIKLPACSKVKIEEIQIAATALRSGEPAALLMTGQILKERGLALAGKIAAATGARLISDTFNARIERGAGRTPVFSLPYFPEKAIESLSGLKHLIIIGTKAPVSFFAYPNTPNRYTPDGCKTHLLASPEYDCVDALERLVDELDASDAKPRKQEYGKTKLPEGMLNPQSIAQAIAALMPEQAVVVDEALSSSLPLSSMTATALPHDWLSITGGAVGQGMPLATGAAVACPDRRVLNLQADGSAMFSLQSLWTQARESLDVTTIIYANHSYKILEIEHQRLGLGNTGPKAHDMLSLDRPDLDWVKLAAGMGVPARKVTTAEEFSQCLGIFLKEPGPNLIEASI